MGTKSWKLTPEEKRNLISAYKKTNLPIKTLAKAYNVCTNSIHRLISRRKIPVRGRKLTEEQRQEIIRLFYQGVKPIAIAWQFKVDADYPHKLVGRRRVKSQRLNETRLGARGGSASEDGGGP